MTSQERSSLVRLKQLFRIVSGATPSPEPIHWGGEIPWATPVDIGKRDGGTLEATDRSISETGLASCATEVAPAGSLVLSTRAPIGYVAETRIPLAINQGCRLLVPKSGVEASFYRYILSIYRERLQALGRGSTFVELGTSDLGNLRVPSPPRVEQRAIVRFLDEETAKIDALIEKKRSLVQRLEEYRKNHVLLMLSGSADLCKATGLDWLPRVPEHWTVAPLYARYQVVLGKMLDQKRLTGMDSYPYLRNINVQWDLVRVNDLPEMDFSSSERTRLRLQEGDLLVCEGGEVGRTAMWRGEIEECYFQKAVHRMRPLTSKDAPRFMFYVMLAAAKSGFFRAGGNPNTIDHLTGEQLRHYRFPFPPKEEQERIAARLDEHALTLSALGEKLQTAIEALSEYRAALITAAVTGQIDVGRAA